MSMVKVYEFVQAEVMEEYYYSDIGDAREQSLIAIIGLNILLNKDPGGIAIPIEFSEELVADLSTMRTATVSGF
ncbi:hypothetical protein PMZ80_000900 [Knufia obscura]|uniref:Phage protein n=1 Tax=Knufia obscura TaxID=1635080 RepID=A0ABR0S1K8_9EURO|nr:hypothetical protein PMZ80_000900 [Knufia obscura]